MASNGMGPVMVLVTVVMLWARTIMAQSDCTNVLIGLAPCLNYVSGSSSTPSPSCCSQLATVVRSQPRCLCTVLLATCRLPLLAAAMLYRADETTPATGSKTGTSGTSNNETLKIPLQLVLFFLFMASCAVTCHQQLLISWGAFE
ncbi:hypothetical protein ACOSQ2_007974 [Xanthoceras sorbifolium]